MGRKNFKKWTSSNILF